MKKTKKRPVKIITGKKITIIVASILAVALVGFSCYWVVKNWNSVKAFFAGTQIYTATDIETAYQDGYTNALADVTEYETLIEEYREEISNQLDEIAEKQAQLTLLLASNQDYADEIVSLREELQNMIDNYNNGLITIEELNTMINTLQIQIADLTNRLSTNPLLYTTQISEILTYNTTKRFWISGIVTFCSISSNNYQEIVIYDGTGYLKGETLPYDFDENDQYFEEINVGDFVVMYAQIRYLNHDFLSSDLGVTYLDVISKGNVLPEPVVVTSRQELANYKNQRVKITLEVDYDAVGSYLSLYFVGDSHYSSNKVSIISYSSVSSLDFAIYHGKIIELVATVPNYGVATGNIALDGMVDINVIGTWL